MGFIIKDQALRPVQSQFSNTLMCDMCWLLAKPQLCWSWPSQSHVSVFQIWQCNMKFWGSVVQRKIYCSNSHPLIWEPLPLPPWWRPDTRQEASEADDLGLLSSDCFSRAYRLANTIFYRAECLHGHLSRYLIHNPDKEPEAKGSFFWRCWDSYFRPWQTRKQGILGTRICTSGSACFCLLTLVNQ